MRFLVCILAAGQGTKMGQHSEFINKALLPLNGKAAISHIIDRFVYKFDRNVKFIIALGYKSEQLRTYLDLAHSNIEFEFCTVDQWQGAGTGPGYSLLACEKHLQSEFFISSVDTLWDQNEELPTTSEWIATSANCFMGLAFIQNYKLFFESIKHNKNDSDKLELQSVFEGLTKNSDVRSQNFKSGKNISTLENYRNLIKDNKFIENLAYDFSKTGEYIYFVDNKVIKFYKSDQRAIDCAVRASQRPDLFFKPTKIQGQFLTYNYISGETLYNYITPELLEKFLAKMKKELWLQIPYDEKKYLIDLNIFYHDLTFERLKDYKKNNPVDKTADKICALLQGFKWPEYYSQAIPKFMHGDLQLDNVVFTPNNDFVLIDPRDLFGKSTGVGDMLYDLAKLYACFGINYLRLKKEGISINVIDHNDSSKPFYKLPKVNYIGLLRKVFRKFLKDEAIPFSYVLLTTAFIYIRMAALHNSPFDKVLIQKGFRILKKLEHIIPELMI